MDVSRDPMGAESLWEPFRFVKLLRDFVLYLVYCAAATLIALAMGFLWRQFFLASHPSPEHMETRHSTER
jgi:hypothetical protein